jgi:probable HAF family extracellular repeat protein
MDFARFSIVAAAVVTMASASAGRRGDVPRPRYALVEIKGPKGEAAFAHALNDRGQVAGGFNLDAPGRPFHAMIWEHGRARDLGTLGGELSDALAIDERGRAVGWSMDAGGREEFVVWEAGKCRAITALANRPSEATAINAHGLIVGTTDLGFTERGGYRGLHSWIWDRGKVIDLGTLGGPSAQANAINKRGQVVGWSQDGAHHRHPFLWDRGVMRDLDPAGGDPSDARAINAAGDVVGYMWKPSRDDAVAFLWRRGKLIDLDWPSAGLSLAHGINDAGDIVGQVEESPARTHALLWRAGALFDLNDCVEPRPSFTLTVAERINNRGEILAVGEGPVREGGPRYFLMVPRGGARGAAPARPRPRRGQ